MNKVYKVVWNQAHGCFMAVAECAKSKGKTTSVKTDASNAQKVSGGSVIFQLKALVAALMLLGLGGVALASNNGIYIQDSGTASDDDCTRVRDNGSLSSEAANNNTKCRHANKATQSNSALFYHTGTGNADSTSLTLGGELYVNSGKLGMGGANNNKIAIGSQATLTQQANNGNNSIAIGTGTTATKAINNNSVAIGNAAEAFGNSAAPAVAVGHASSANGASAAFGVGADALSSGSTAFGSAGPGNDPDGLTAHTRAIATGQNAAAIGTGSRAQAARSVAIGDHTFANAKDAADRVIVGNVSLGVGSVADRGAAEPLAGVSGRVWNGTADVAGGNQATDSTAKAYDPTTGGNTTQSTSIAATNSNIGAVSVGGKTKTAGGPTWMTSGNTTLRRQITNVAGGSQDTDAVNVAQLKAVATVANRKNYFHVNTGVAGQTAGIAATNEGTVDAKGGAGSKHSLAAGVDATVGSTFADNSIAVGKGATVAAGETGATSRNSENAIAVGAGANVKGSKTIAIGANAAVITGLYDPDADTHTQPTNATNSVRTQNSMAIGADALVAGTTESRKNNGGKYFVRQATAIGYKSRALDGEATAVGSQTQARGFQSVALGSKAVAKYQQSTAIGNNTSALSLGAVSLGGDDTHTRNAKGEPDQPTAFTDADGATVEYGAENKGISAASGTHYRPTLSGGRGATSVGVHAQTLSEGSVAIGIGATAGKVTTTKKAGELSSADFDAATGKRSTAIGAIALAQGKESTAIGVLAKATGDESAAIGSNTEAKGANSSAVGYDAVAHTEGSVALGEKAVAGNATGAKDAVAIGTTTKANALNGVAIGTSAEVTKANGVALGANSKANTAAGVVGVNPLNATIDEASSTWKSTKAAVSVGDVDNNITRQITDVAAGTAPTDAVNVAQLNSVAQTPLTVKGNANKDTDAETLAGKTYTAGDGTQQQLGETLNIIGATTAVAGTARSTDTATAGAYSAKNVQTVVSNGEVQIQLAENPEFTSVKAGDTKIDTNGLTITGGPSVTKTGIDADSKKITNVANGTVGENSKDAVNGGQLHTTNTNVTNNANKIAKGFNIDADNRGGGLTAADNVQLDDTVKYTSTDKSVTTTVTNNQIDLEVNETKVDIAYSANAGTDKTVSLSQGLDFTNGTNTTAEIGDNGVVKFNVVTEELATSGGKVTATASDAPASAKSVADAINSAYHTVEGKNSTAQVTATDGSAKIKAGDKVTIEAGKNLELAADATGKLQLSTSNKVAFEEVKTGDTVIKDGSIVVNNTETDPTKQVSLTDTGLNNGGNKITNVADGTVDANSKDAVNGSQLHAVKESPITFKANTNADTDADGSQQKLGSEFSILGAAANTDFANSDEGKNIYTKVEDGKVTIGLAKDLDVTSVKAGESKLTNDGLTITGGPSVTKTGGVDAGGKTITNVANGTANSDAVNVSQLNKLTAASKTEVKKGTNVASVVKDTADAADGGHDIYTINADGAKVSAGSTAVKVTAGTKDTATNITDYAVDLSDATKGTLAKAEAGFNISADNAEAGASDAAGKKDNVKLTETVKYTSSDKSVTTTVTNNQIDLKVNETKVDIAYSANDGTDKTVSLAKGLDFTNGTNTTAEIGDNGVVKFNVVTEELATSGGKVASTTSDAPASAKSVADAINASGFTLKTSASTGGEKDAASTADELINPADTVTIDAGKNLKVKQSANGVVSLATKDDVVFNKVTSNTVVIGDATNTTTLTSGANGLDVGGDKITNVAAGVVNATSKDAVNGSQLHATNTNVTNNANKIAKGFNIDADNRGSGLTAPDNVQLDETVKYTSTDQSVTTTVSNNQIDLEVNEAKVDIAYSANGGTDKTVSLAQGLDFANGTNTTAEIGDNGVVKFNVVTEELTTSGGKVASTTSDAPASAKSVADAINNAYHTVEGKNSTAQVTATDGSAKIKAGDKVTIEAGKNLELAADATGKLQLSTSENPEFKSVTIGDATDPNKSTKLTSTNKGLDVGGDKVTNVADGTVGENSKDAVNGGQLNKVITDGFGVNADKGGKQTHALAKELAITAGNTTEDTSSDNLLTRVEQDANTGKTTVKISMKDSPTFKGTVTAKDIVATNGTNTIKLDSTAGDITGLTNKDTKAADFGTKGRAATEEQIKEVIGFSKGSGGFGLKAQDGNEVTKALGNTVEVVGVGSTAGNYSGNNVKTAVVDGKVQVQIAENPEFKSVTIGDATDPNKSTKLTSTDKGLDVGGDKVTNIGKGDISATSTDAVRGDQIKSIIDKGFKISADNGAEDTVALGEGVKYTSSDKTVTTTVDNNQIDFKVTTTTLADANNDGKVDTPATADATKLVNAGDVAKAINNAGFIATSDGNQATGSTKADQLVKAGEKVTLAADDNLEVKQEAGKFTFATKKEVVFDKVTSSKVVVGDATNSTTLTSGANGLDVGGDKITNVADGTVDANSKDAVNGSQLHAVKESPLTFKGNVNEDTDAATGYAAGDGTQRKLSETLEIVGTGADAAATYSGNNIKTKVTDGKVEIQMTDRPTFGTTKINDGGTGKITGLAAGDITKDSTDAVNGSQLFDTNNQVAGNTKALGGGAKYDPATNKYTPPTFETTTTDGKKVEANDVATALTNLNNEVLKPLTVTGNANNDMGADGTQQKLGSKLAIEGGYAGTAASNDNVKTVVTDGKVEIQIADAPTFKGTVTAPTFTTSGTNAVTVSGDTGTVTGLTNKTFDPAAPVSGQAATEDQLKSVYDKANTGFKLTTAATSEGEVSGTSVEQVQPDETVTIEAGKNIKVTQDKNKVTVATEDEVEFSKTTVGKVVTDGTTNKITGLEDGTVSATSKDAVNGSQLFDTNQQVAGNTKALGGGAKYDPATDTYTPPTFKTTTTDGKTVDANDVATALTNLNNEVLKPITFAGDSGKDVERKLGETLTIAGDGKNVSTEADGTGKVTVKMSDTPTFNKVSVTNGPTVSDTGIDMGNDQIKNLASAGDITDAANAKNAVNAGDLNTAINKSNTDLTAKGLDFGANEGTKVHRDLGTKLDVLGKATTAGTYSGNNVKTVTDPANGAIQVQIAEAPVFAGKVSAKGVDAGGEKITNVKAGDTGSDAVNYDQLKALADKVTNVNSNIVTLEGNSPFTFMSDDGNKTQLVRIKDANTGAYTFYKPSDLDTNNNPKAGATPYTGDVVTSALNSATDTIAPQRIVNVSEGKDPTDAVNVSQLKQSLDTIGGGAGINPDGSVKKPTFTTTKTDGTTVDADNVGDALTNLNNEVVKPIAFEGNKGSTVTKKLGETLAVKGGLDNTAAASNKNVRVDSEGGELVVKLADSPTFDGKVTANKGFDAAGNKVENVAEGALNAGSKDAVNGSQLYATNLNVEDAQKQAAGNTDALGGGAKYDPATNTYTAPTFETKDAAGNVVATPAKTVAGGLTNLNDYVNKGFGVQESGTTKGTVTPTEAINFVNGKNTVAKVTDEANGVTNVTFDVSAEQMRGSGPVQYTSTNNAAGSNTIDNSTPKNTATLVGENGNTDKGVTLNNVADGAVTPDSKQAVNGSQLRAAADANKAIYGGNATVQPDGTITMGDVGGTGESNIHDAIKNVNATANKGFNVTAQGKNSSNVAPGETVDLNNTDGNITVVKKADEDKVTFGLAKDITVDSVTAGDTKLDKNGLTITGGPSVTKAGINAAGNKVTGVKDGDIAANSTDAINGSQLHAITGDTSATYTNQNGKGIKYFRANSTGSDAYARGADSVAMGKDAIAQAPQSVALGANSVATARDANQVKGYVPDAIEVVNPNDPQNPVKFGPSQAQVAAVLRTEAKPDVGSVAVGDEGKKVYRQITGVAAGSKDTDAVNVAQLKAVQFGVNDVIDRAVKYDLNPDGSVDYNNVTMGQGQIPQSTDGGKTGGVKLTNLAQGDLSENSTDSVNGAQLYSTNQEIAAVKDDLSKKQFGLTADDGKSVKKNLDSTISIAGGDNVTTKVNASGAVEVNLDKNITVDSVAVTNGPTLNNKGIQMGDTQITGLKSGLVDAAGNTVTLANATGDTLNNAANIGDLQKVQGTVNSVSTVVGGSGNEKADQLAIKTYSVEGQEEKTNNTVISAIKSMNEGGIKYFHTNDTANQYTTGETNSQDSSAGGGFSTAVGYKAKTEGDKSVAFGNSTVAKGESSVAIGDGAQANGKQTISIGTRNIVNGDHSGAIGDPTIIDGKNTYSVGNNNTVNADNVFVLGNEVKINKGVDEAVALGNKASVTTKGSVALGAGSVAGAANLGQYTVDGVKDADVQAKPTATTQVVSVGSAGKERQIQNVAAGVVSKTSTDAINGSQLYNTHKAIAAARQGGVQYATNPDGTPNYNQVNLAGDTYNPQTGEGGTRVSNVAPGVKPSDAVNVQQLNAGLRGLDDKINNVNADASAGTASAMAAGSIPQAILPGKGLVGVGVGHYRGTNALAVGASTVTDNGKWIFKGTVNVNSRGHTGVGVGAGFQW